LYRRRNASFCSTSSIKKITTNVLFEGISKSSSFQQLQVGLQANVPQPHELYEEDDDVDTALKELQVIKNFHNEYKDEIK